MLKVIKKSTFFALGIVYVNNIPILALSIKQTKRNYGLYYWSKAND
tara:strand:+ start:3302 stop:3439 length:138 start_codon:yes stop_codon:yes gene_type:complete